MLQRWNPKPWHSLVWCQLSVCMGWQVKLHPKLEWWLCQMLINTAICWRKQKVLSDQLQFLLLHFPKKTHLLYIEYWYRNERWTDVEALAHFADSNKVAVVYFTAKWCGPCKFMHPSSVNSDLSPLDIFELLMFHSDFPLVVLLIRSIISFHL